MVEWARWAMKPGISWGSSAGRAPALGAGGRWLETSSRYQMDQERRDQLEIENVLRQCGQVGDAVTRWREFSQIQCATWIVVGADSLARFRTWIETGDREECWV